MASYIVELYQSGGCDYTIGCGTVVENLKATTYADALEEVEELLEYYGLDRINSATIYEVKSTTGFDVGGVKARRKREREEEAARKKEAKERAELARLQAKYTKGG